MAKKYINYLYLDDQTHEWVNNASSTLGVPVRKFIADQLSEIATEHLFCGAPELTGVTKFQVLEQWLHSAREAALTYLKLQDSRPDLYDDLDKLCKRIGMSADEMIEQVASDPVTQAVAQNKTLTKKAKCMEWLADYLDRCGGEKEVAVIYSMADELGFSASTLERARRELNNNGKELISSDMVTWRLNK